MFILGGYSGLGVFMESFGSDSNKVVNRGRVTNISEAVTLNEVNQTVRRQLTTIQISARYKKSKSIKTTNYTCKPILEHSS